MNVERYIIETNSFTMDTRGIRLQRLQLLKQNIERFASELSFEPGDLEWCLSAFDNYSEAMNLQSRDSALKAEKSRLSIESDAALYERYVVLKDLLNSRMKDNTDKLELLGIDGAIPFNREERISKAFQLIEANEKIRENESELSLPQLMVDNLRTLAEDAKNKYMDVANLKQKSANSTQELNLLFGDNSLKLRYLYNWTVAFWGKRDVRLYDLGFVPSKSVHFKLLPPQVTNIQFDPTTKTLTWSVNPKATKYQVALRNLNSTSEWYEDYFDSNNFYTTEKNKGEWSLKVRAWNEYGFSEWSQTQKLDLYTK